MALALYMDHHVASASTDGLRRRGIDVLTTQEDGTRKFPDSDLLDRATSLERILFTRDEDLLAEGAYRQRNGILFYGIVYAHQLHVSIGTCIGDLEMICQVGDTVDVMNRVIYLPL